MDQLTVRIDDNLRERLQRLARREGKSTSEVVRGLVQRYARNRDRSAGLRTLWNQMERSAEKAGTGPGEVAKAIRAVRRKSHVEESRGAQSRDEPVAIAIQKN